jgi:malonyl-CoA/methylmalonyl-CoA synthetase
VTLITAWQELVASKLDACIRDDAGEHTADAIAVRARRIARHLASGSRVGILLEPSADWLAAFFAVIEARAIVVPLSPRHPKPEIERTLIDADADKVLTRADLADRCGGRGLCFDQAVRDSPDRGKPSDSRRVAASDVAMLLYTSGTTGTPKGAMLTHHNLLTQTRLLADAWQLGAHTVLAHALPLHHMHGVVVALLATLFAGGRTLVMPRFDPDRMWRELSEPANTLMSVPTMYSRLFEAFDASAAERDVRRRAAARMRLCTSGSAGLPASLAERWRELSGAIPLERYGMTEIGVAVSNPVDPAARRTGWVGLPLPTVELRLRTEEGARVDAGEGELEVRGPSVFAGYWRKLTESEAAFDEGWLVTGDAAVRDEHGWIRIVGRRSVDILKCGGFKLSAIEIEETLREHPAIADVGVVGLPDDELGQLVAAAVVPRTGMASECEADRLRNWARERLAGYKVPGRFRLVDALPRNAMGKVQKHELARRLKGREK